MGDSKDKGIEDGIARLKEQVAQEVAQHADEDINLEDMEDVAGGWEITYKTDPPKPVDEQQS
jgi:hypothetical protein